MTQQQRPCSACFGQRTGIVTETFRLDLDAFQRHAELVDSGHAPSLCIRRDGNRHVCHLPLPASMPADRRTSGPAVPLPWRTNADTTAFAP